MARDIIVRLRSGNIRHCALLFRLRLQRQINRLSRLTEQRSEIDWRLVHNLEYARSRLVYAACKMRYGQFCPIAKAAEIVAERWTPLVVHEMLAGSTHFSDIRRGVPLMSQTLLSD